MKNWTKFAVASSATGGGLLYVGFFLYMADQVGCTIDNVYSGTGSEADSTCKRTFESSVAVLVGTGLALEAVALVTGTVAAKYGLDLWTLNKKSNVDVSFHPSMDPISGAVGLATRLDF